MKNQPSPAQSQRAPRQGTQPGGLPTGLSPSRSATPNGWGGGSAAQARMLLLAAAVLALALPRVLAGESYVAYIGPVTVDTRLLPAIIQDPQSVTNLSGATATFTVNATGTAPLAYQWRKDTLPLADGG